MLPTDCSLLESSCDGSLCLYLYTGDKSLLTWSAGYDKCASEKLEILRIETSHTQTLAEQLLNKLPDSSDRKAWIGGKRSTDNSWIYMNGTVFSKTSKYTFYLRSLRYRLIFWFAVLVTSYLTGFVIRLKCVHYITSYDNTTTIIIVIIIKHYFSRESKQ